ncbi:hypothetical protein ES703_51552 [subsurface metagenome]
MGAGIPDLIVPETVVTRLFPPCSYVRIHEITEVGCLEQVLIHVAYLVVKDDHIGKSAS